VTTADAARQRMLLIDMGSCLLGLPRAGGTFPRRTPYR